MVAVSRLSALSKYSFFSLSFKFLGNKVDGNYTASLDYKSIELKEKKVRKKEKRKYNLSESFSLQCDTNAYKTDASTFAIMRPIPLNESEKNGFHEHSRRCC